MLIIWNSDGTITKVLPDRVYQGSNEAANLYCVAPFAPNVQITVAFRLADGTITEPSLMTPSTSNEGETSNIWFISIEDYITNYYGVVDFQFSAISNGKRVNSSGGSFIVERGIAPILPPEPSADIYEQILEYLSALQGDVLNSYIISLGINHWTDDFNYPLSALTYAETDDKIKFYVSKVSDNLNHEVTNSAYWIELDYEPAFSKNTAFNKNFETNTNNIKMNGTVDVGSTDTIARADHVHPTDTTREPVFSKNTAFNKNFETNTSNIKMNGDTSVGVESTIARADHIHPKDTSKLAVNPNGTDNLIDNNYKINSVYIPDYILGQMIYGGTLNATTAVATLTDNAKEKLGTTDSTIILTNNTDPITGYIANQGIYYIVQTSGTFAGHSFEVGDWLVASASGWGYVDNTDAVSSVNGKIGIVILKSDDISDADQTNKWTTSLEKEYWNGKLDSEYYAEFNNQENTRVLIKATANVPFNLYLFSSSLDNCTIYWENSIKEDIEWGLYTEKTVQHTYPSSGFYWVIIKSSNGITGMPNLYVNNQTDKELYYKCYLADYKNSSYSLGDYAFYGCENLYTVTIPQGMIYIGRNAFNGSGIRSIDLSQASTIGDYAFANCFYLKDIKLGKNLRSIGDYAFASCSNLYSIDLPEFVMTSIGEGAFIACINLRQITLPKTITTISDAAFAGCTGLESITVLSSIPATLGVGAFSDTNNCPIYVPYANLSTYKTNWSSYENRIFPIADGDYIKMLSDGITSNTDSIDSIKTSISNQIYIDSVLGTDDGAGTILNPVKTLSEAIALANSLTDATGFEIHIAQGTYTESGDITLPNKPIVIYGNNASIINSGYTITIPNPYFIRYNLFTTSNVVYDNFSAGARCIVQGGGITGNVTVNSYVEMFTCQLNDGTVTVGETGQLLCTLCSPTSVFISAGALFLDRVNINTGKTSYLIDSTGGQLTVANSLITNLSTGGCIHCENGATILPNILSNNFIVATSGNTILAGTAHTIYSKNYISGTAPSGSAFIGVNSDILGAGTIMQLGSDATGDLYYRNVSGLLTRLGIGSNGQYLKSNGSVPVYESPDTTPTDGSSKLLTSGGAKFYIDNKISTDSTFAEKINNPQNTIIYLQGNEETAVGLYLSVTEGQDFYVYRDDGSSSHIVAESTGAYTDSYVFGDSEIHRIAIESSDHTEANMPNIFVNSQADATKYRKFFMSSLQDSIIDYSLAGCTMIDTIDWNGSLVSIGEDSFYQCGIDSDGVKQVGYLGNVSNFGSWAFEESSFLIDEIVLHVPVATFGQGVFSLCSYPRTISMARCVAEYNSFDSSITTINLVGSIISTFNSQHLSNTNLKIYVRQSLLDDYKALSLSNIDIYPIIDGSYVDEIVDRIGDLETNKSDKSTTLSGYGITDAYTKTEVDNIVSSVYKYKGSVADYASLPTTGLTVGDVYNVEDTGDNYAWTGTEWDKLSGTVDLSGYVTKATEQTITGLKYFDYDKARFAITSANNDYRRAMTQPQTASTAKRFILGTPDLSTPYCNTSTNVYMENNKLYSNASEVVNLTDGQTITGLKTFTKDIIVDKSLPFVFVKDTGEYNVAPAENRYYGFEIKDKNNIYVASARARRAPNNNTQYQLVVRSCNNTTKGAFFTATATDKFSFEPSNDNEINLGGSTLRWKDLYISGNAIGILKEFTATLPYTSWTGSSAPYSKEITVSGILATDKLDIDLDLSSSTYSNVETIQTSWSKVYRAVSDAGTITFYASEIPTIDIPLQIKVVR